MVDPTPIAARPDNESEPKEMSGSTSDQPVKSSDTVPLASPTSVICDGGTIPEKPHIRDTQR